MNVYGNASDTDELTCGAALCRKAPHDAASGVNESSECTARMYENPAAVKNVTNINGQKITGPSSG